MAIEPCPYEFTSLDGGPASSEERRLLETARGIALNIQSVHPLMLPHDIATRVFSDVLLPFMADEQRRDRELCDWLVRSIRESISVPGERK